jgi:RNA polymerase sigma factor (TIGR02999 family)
MPNSANSPTPIEALPAHDPRFHGLYSDLRRMARSRLRRHETFTLLGTTDLVHETFLRLSRAGGVREEDAAAFLAYAGQVMRSVIVDAARARLAQRRGSGARKEEFDEESVEPLDTAPAQAIVDVHDALLTLRVSEPRLTQVIELQYFAGMTELEIAAALGLSDRTVRRDAERARLLLRALLA